VLIEAESGGGRDRPPGRVPDRRRVAAGEAGGFNEEQKVLTADGTFNCPPTGDARQSYAT